VSKLRPLLLQFEFGKMALGDVNGNAAQQGRPAVAVEFDPAARGDTADLTVRQ
jgi:hypothetical protein